MNRARFLRLGTAGVLGAGLVAPRAASAALPAPTPQGDDIGFLSFAVVAEMASARGYQNALRVKGWPAGVRRTVSAVVKAKGAHIRRINDVLRDGAVQPSDFGAAFPKGAFDTQPRALALLGNLEGLLVSTYLFGVSYAADSSTRLLLGRLLAYDAEVLAWLRTAAGEPAAQGLHVPLDLETAGAQLDRYLTTPSFG
jgi:ferritin-like protein